MVDKGEPLHLIEAIADAEAGGRALEPCTELRDHWTQSAVDFARDLTEQMDSRPAYRAGPPADNLRCWPVREDGRSIDEALRIFASSVVDNGLNPASGGHLGYIPGGGLYASALADYLAAVSNKYTGIHYACPGAVQMENMMLEWLRDLVGYPATTAGNLASGGSLANLSAIVTARDALGIRGDRIRQSVIYGLATHAPLPPQGDTDRRPGRSGSPGHPAGCRLPHGSGGTPRATCS